MLHQREHVFLEGQRAAKDPGAQQAGHGFAHPADQLLGVGAGADFFRECRLLGGQFEVRHLLLREKDEVRDRHVHEDAGRGAVDDFVCIEIPFRDEVICFGHSGFPPVGDLLHVL